VNITDHRIYRDWDDISATSSPRPILEDESSILETGSGEEVHDADFRDLNEIGATAPEA